MSGRTNKLSKVKNNVSKISENYGDLLSKDSSLESINISQLQEQIKLWVKR